MNSSDLTCSRKVLIASNNRGKINEFEKFFSKYSLEIVPQPKELNIDENGMTFVDNARIKALAASASTGLIALADDSGLCVKSLGGAPGIFSSRYAENDSNRIIRLLQELKGFDDRSAFFSAALCLASPRGEILLEVQGRCDGFITLQPRGRNGFGYDPIFEVNGTGLTFSEMNSDQKRALSHRGRALEALIPGLERIFACC